MYDEDDLEGRNKRQLNSGMKDGVDFLSLGTSKTNGRWIDHPQATVEGLLFPRQTTEISTIGARGDVPEGWRTSMGER